MMSKKQLIIVNNALKEINDTQQLFGEKTLILGGDFRQTLPIIIKSDKQ